jgi:hypothetical protein
MRMEPWAGAAAEYRGLGLKLTGTVGSAGTATGGTRKLRLSLSGAEAFSCRGAKV